MKLRIRYSKLGSLRFIGHLDVMRYFQKEIRRAGLKVSYSQGYSPHQIISFAAPLAMGITSEGEYFDG
jgi:radical SAM-linked protein